MCRPFLEQLSFSALRSLSLCGTGIGPKGCTALADAVERLLDLEALSVSDNPICRQIGPVAATRSGPALKSPPRRQRLGRNAGSNDDHDGPTDQTGWERICDVVRASRLHTFDCANVGMSSIGCERLSSSFSPVLTALDISRNNCDLSAGSALLPVIVGSTLRSLTLGRGWRMPVHDAKVLDLDLPDTLDEFEISAVAACVSTDSAISKLTVYLLP